MFDGCQKLAGEPRRCSDVAEKLVHLFGWRQTYKVEKLQRSLTVRPHGDKSALFKTYSLNAPTEPSRFRRESARMTIQSLNSSGRSADSWVAVRSLQTSDGGILDPDDRLNDVADDREQIVAAFSDGEGPHHGGDGASGSSVGTGSPDIFQGDGKYYPQAPDIEVTGEQLGSSVLQVRRGSEPALNQLEVGGGTPGAGPGPPPSNNKRWSAAPIIIDMDDDRPSKIGGVVKQNGYHDSDWMCIEEESKTGYLKAPGFQRDGSNRLSMQFAGDDGGMKWLDAAQQARSSLPRDSRRREPLGQDNSNRLHSLHAEVLKNGMESMGTDFVVLRNEGGPLGIHVVPDYDEQGRDRGLLVQGVEPCGQVARDGRLAVGDRIVEINGQELLSKPFHRVQEIFKNSLSSGELRLRVVKYGSQDRSCRPPAPVYPDSTMVEPRERASATGTAKVATVSPTKKVPAGAVAANLLQTANTRKMGRVINLELLKGPAGLGFSITTRDNPAGGNCPIYIKNILAKGAAVDDGRLRAGDRLLKVNDIEMTGKTQPEAVAILRQAPPGSVVKITVSRQGDSGDANMDVTPERQARPVKPERADEANRSLEMNGVRSVENGDTRKRRPSQELLSPSHRHEKTLSGLDESQIFPWRHREILTFDIPVHDTEKAGLGVSVKGKTSANHSMSSLNSSNQAVDLGIFVKSVIHGGAASRDGRLRTNDQLLSVNGRSLLNQNNGQAMETLRRAMLYMEGPRQGVISLTIARRVSTNPQDGPELSRMDSDSGLTPDQSLIGSETSDSTVIFLPYPDNKHHDSILSQHSARLNDSNTSNASQVSRNPVIDRLTGRDPAASQPNSNNLRNESYYRATHDTTWNTSYITKPKRGGKLTSPTVNPATAEPVLIEEDCQRPLPVNTNGPRRNNTSSDVVRRPLQEVQQQQQQQQQNLINQRSDGSVSGSGQSISTHGDVTYASQLSLEDTLAGFSRDAFGRQSMSEKRHATLDAKNTDTYRRNKKLREERIEQQQQSPQRGGGQRPVSARVSQMSAKIAELLEQGRAPHRPCSAESMAESVYQGNNVDTRGRPDLGPALGMKKSSSLESLQTMVQEMQMAEDPDPAYTYRNAQGAVRVVRGRGCNESFRAAVDRSYDAPLGLRNHMDTLCEEENAIVDRLENSGNEEALLGRGTIRQSSMNAVRDAKHKHKKKPGLLKGIGSMFRFGKHRKPTELTGGMEEEEEEALEEDRGGDSSFNGPTTSESAASSSEREREEARLAAKEEHDKIQEQYRRLMQRVQQQQQHENHYQMQSSEIANNVSGHSDQQRWDNAKENNRNGRTERREGGLATQQAVVDLPSSRSQRIHQLRAAHQRRHAERHGQYPLEQREERYEEVIRQRLDRPNTHPAHPLRPTTHPNHVRSSSYDPCAEIDRPGSRVGISDPASFSHYVNYEEIQQHLKGQLSSEQLEALKVHRLRELKLKELSRRKQHYHSQRRDNREQQQRPVSNFYEYESVQSVMNARSRVPHQTPSVRSTVSYLNQLSQQSAVPTRYDSRPRGPFISQITIRETPNES